MSALILGPTNYEVKRRWMANTPGCERPWKWKWDVRGWVGHKGRGACGHVAEEGDVYGGKQDWLDVQ